MAQQVKIAGALFDSVPSIRVPDANDAYHPFVDPSVTTATASDVAQGKQFIAADGTVTQGTASGGGGGLEYESGTWTPTSDVSDYTIQFSKQHTVEPAFYMVSDAMGNDSGTANSNLAVYYANWYQATGEYIQGTSIKRYGAAGLLYRSSSGIGASSANITTAQDGTWATPTGIRAYTSSSSRYWRAGRTYAWIAVWAPTS